MRKQLATMVVAVFGVSAALACGGGSGAGGAHAPSTDHASPRAAQQPDLIVDLKAKNVRFEPSEIEIPAGKLVRIDFENQDEGTEHDFQVDGLDVEIIESEGGDMHSGGGNMLAAHAASEGRASVLFRAMKKGTFEIYCTLPGHKDAGMVGMLRVV